MASALAVRAFWQALLPWGWTGPVDLPKTRAEAKERGWTPQSWHVIGRELGKLTTRVSKKRDGRAFNCYRIPRVA